MRTRSQRQKKDEVHQWEKKQQKKSVSKQKKSAKKQTKQSAKKEQKSVSAHKQKSKSASKPPKSTEKKKKKVLKKEKPAKQGYTEAQKKQFNELYDEYMGMGAQALKNILAANTQTKTGTKDILAERCADGKLLGRIPTCLSCGGGRLKFDRKTGIYRCPGYMDDDVFKNCGKKYGMDEIIREPWTQP